MKKLLSGVIAIVLSALCAFGLVACSGGNWDQDAVFKNWGEVVASSNGSFVAETENYYYFINGEGDSTADNAYGVPVKGALMAAKKDDVTKTCVVIPQLFVAKDYKSGLFLKGDYVYYATTSTDKTADGSIANTELKFCRTKLDGTDKKELFAVTGLDTQYRIIDVNGTVHIVYYDADETAIIDYNVSTLAKKTVVKTDIKAESESLNTYVFAENEYTDSFAVLYSVTIYNRDYDEEDAKSSSYTRSSESYNKIYAYKAGKSAAELVLDGSENNSVYEISFVKSGYVFYTETSALSDSVITAKTYAATPTDLYAKNPATRLYNTSYVNSSAIINSLTEAYVADSADSTRIRKVNLVSGNEDEETVVILSAAAAELLFVLDNSVGNYLYYYNASGNLARKELGADKLEQRISESTVSTGWYAPVIRGDYIYYLDSSSYGASYVKRVNINSTENITTEYNEKEEPTLVYLTGNEFVAKKTDADEVAIFGQLLSDVTTNGKIVFETRDKADADGEKGSYILKDGVPYMEKMDKAISAYAKLTDAQKKLLAEESVENYNKYEKAYGLSKSYFKLLGFDSSLPTAEKDAYLDAYKEAKAKLNAVINSGIKQSEIGTLLAENMAYYYQEANEYFAAK